MENLKRRAPKACHACRSRKVRCDVSSTGTPCTNCAGNQSECSVSYARKKRKSSALIESIVPSSRTHAFEVVTSRSANDDAVRKAVSHLPNSDRWPSHAFSGGADWYNKSDGRYAPGVENRLSQRTDTEQQGRLQLLPGNGTQSSPPSQGRPPHYMSNICTLRQRQIQAPQLCQCSMKTMRLERSSRAG